MPSNTNTAPRRGNVASTEEKRVSVDMPVAYFDLICAAASENERTIPAQIRLIVREWAEKQPTP